MHEIEDNHCHSHWSVGAAGFPLYVFRYVDNITFLTPLQRAFTISVCLHLQDIHTRYARRSLNPLMVRFAPSNLHRHAHCALSG